MLHQYILLHKKSLFLMPASAGIFAVVFAAYRLELEAVFYAVVLCAILWLLTAIFDFQQYRIRHKRLQMLAKRPLLALMELPQPSNLVEEDYRELIFRELSERQRIVLEYEQEKQERSDYDTMWVHQIKTPIAAMRLLLSEQDTPEYRELSAELFQVERYVEMLLSYGKLTSTENDLVICYHDLDEMIRQAVRKYASQFVRKKLELSRQDTGFSILTDEKWFVFVLEQLLSNALKYTNSGKIAIYPLDKREEEQKEFPTEKYQKCLVLEDTGIGIAPEDLPRIFEKGYTGLNGRTGKESTGIGLYLCKKVFAKLGHGIRMESEVGKGTKVYLYLDAYGEKETEGN